MKKHVFLLLLLLIGNFIKFDKYETKTLEKD